MLHEALRIEDTDVAHLGNFMLIDQVSQKSFITTSALNNTMSAWLQRIQTYPDAADERRRTTNVKIRTKHAPEYYKRFQATMKSACGVWRLLMQPTNPALATPKLLSGEILVSIEILGEALDCGITEICGSRSNYAWRRNPRSEWLMQKMIRQG